MESFCYSPGFSLRNGFMFCEDVSVQLLQAELSSRVSPSSPFFLYSKTQLVNNIDSYKKPLAVTGMKYELGYSLKANFNPHVVKIMEQNGLIAITVSGNETRLAMQQGFTPDRIIFNGNGKQSWELELAIVNGIRLNVDSLFDIQHIQMAAQRLHKTVQILLRINPHINPDVHPYLATGIANSKFGIDKKHLQVVTDLLKQQSDIQLVGLHCHLGSTITDAKVYRECAEFMLRTVEELKGQGFKDIHYLNIGGGLGIDYLKHKCRTVMDSEEMLQKTKPLAQPSDITNDIRELMTSSGLTLILEPGRSLVGSAAVLVTKVLGSKRNGATNYIVVDGAMTEVIRPSLYGAYHHIELAEPTQVPQPHRHEYSVVGPVCESGDHLGKERFLLEPHTGCLLAIFDVGAYGASMACNYNMRMRPSEILVDVDKWTIIRKPDSFEDIIKPYAT